MTDTYTPPLQALPSWLTYVQTIIPNPTGTGFITSRTILTLPLTYYGPSIPLGTDGVWTYGGLTPPPSTSTAPPTTSPTTTPAPSSSPTTLPPTTSSPITSSSSPTTSVTSASSSQPLTTTSPPPSSITSASSSAAPSSSTSAVPPIAASAQGLSTGIIAAIALGAAIVSVALVFLIWFCTVRAIQRRREYERRHRRGSFVGSTEIPFGSRFLRGIGFHTGGVGPRPSSYLRTPDDDEYDADEQWVDVAAENGATVAYRRPGGSAPQMQEHGSRIFTALPAPLRTRHRDSTSSFGTDDPNATGGYVPPRTMIGLPIARNINSPPPDSPTSEADENAQLLSLHLGGSSPGGASGSGSGNGGKPVSWADWAAAIVASRQGANRSGGRLSWFGGGGGGSAQVADVEGGARVSPFSPMGSSPSPASPTPPQQRSSPGMTGVAGVVAGERSSPSHLRERSEGRQARPTSEYSSTSVYYDAQSRPPSGYFGNGPPATGARQPVSPDYRPVYGSPLARSTPAVASAVGPASSTGDLLDEPAPRPAITITYGEKSGSSNGSSQPSAQPRSEDQSPLSAVLGQFPQTPSHDQLEVDDLDDAPPQAGQHWRERSGSAPRPRRDDDYMSGDEDDLPELAVRRRTLGQSIPDLNSRPTSRHISEPHTPSHASLSSLSSFARSAQPSHQSLVPDSTGGGQQSLIHAPSLSAVMGGTATTGGSQYHTANTSTSQPQFGSITESGRLLRTRPSQLPVPPSPALVEDENEAPPPPLSATGNGAFSSRTRG